MGKENITQGFVLLLIVQGNLTKNGKKSKQKFTPGEQGNYSRSFLLKNPLLCYLRGQISASMAEFLFDFIA